MAATFKHTNFLRNDRYQAKLNAARACARRNDRTILILRLTDGTRALDTTPVVGMFYREVE